MQTSIVIIAVLAMLVLLFLFGYFTIEAAKLLTTRNTLADILAGHGDTLESLRGTDLEPLSADYRRDVRVRTPDGQRSNVPAAHIFCPERVARLLHINLRQLDAAGRTLVVISLFATFLGLAVAIISFHADAPMAVTHLLDSLGLAAIPALIGLGLAAIHSLLFRRWLNGATINLSRIAERVDEDLYVSDVELIRLNALSAAGVVNNRIDAAASIVRGTHNQLVASTTTIVNAIQSVPQAKPAPQIAVAPAPAPAPAPAKPAEPPFDAAVLAASIARAVASALEPVTRLIEQSARSIDRSSNTIADSATSSSRRMAEGFEQTNSQIKEYIQSLAGGTTTIVSRVMDHLEKTITELITKNQTDTPVAATVDLEPLMERMEQAISNLAEQSAARTEATAAAVPAITAEEISPVTTDLRSLLADIIAQAQAITTASTDAIDRMVARFEEKMQEMSDRTLVMNEDAIKKINTMLDLIEQSMSQIAADSRSTAEGTTQAATERISSMADSIRQSLSELINHTTALTDGATEQITALTSNLNRSAEAVLGFPEMISQASRSLADSATSANEAINTAIVESTRSLADQVGKSLYKTAADVSNGQASLVKQQAQALRQTTTMVEQINKCLDRLAKSTDSLGSSSDSLTASADSLTSVRQDLCNLTENIATATANFQDAGNLFVNKFEKLSTIQQNNDAVIESLFKLSKITLQGSDHYAKLINEANANLASMLGKTNDDTKA